MTIEGMRAEGEGDRCFIDLTERKEGAGDGQGNEKGVFGEDPEPVFPGREAV